MQIIKGLLGLDVAREKLQKIFGFKDFRGPQGEIIESCLKGQNSLVVMPTGMGKSLCYQLPSQIFEGLTLVISPLIALMKDQVDAAQKKGINCCFINSSLSPDERKKRYKKLAQNQYDLVYVTPERFKKPEFREAISKNKVDLLAIDEAHCISEWGHDFRPDYTRIHEFIEFLNQPRVMALTATATLDTQEDIIKQLGLDNINKFIAGIERDNLKVHFHDVYGMDEKLRHIIALNHQIPGPGIVYFSLISSLEEVSKQLESMNIEHTIYHGRLPDKLRKRNQEDFLEGKIDLILATPAFGLGVDKSNIRFVVHAELPGSIESYYQEIGRAGRDGETSECHLLYDGDDISIQMDFIKWGNPDPEFIKTLYNKIKNDAEKINALGMDYLRKSMNFYNSRDFRLETALNLLERWDCIEYGKKKSIKIKEELDSDFLNMDLYKKRLKSQNEKLLEMVQLFKETECRKKVVYKYFGVESEDCGFCDNCLGLQ